MPTKQPSSEIAAVLRREAEQLLRDVGAACVDTRKQSDIAACAHCSAQVDKIEAFARRQRQEGRQEALKDALTQLETDMEQPGFVDAVEWLSARAAAEGTET